MSSYDNNGYRKDLIYNLQLLRDSCDCLESFIDDFVDFANDYDLSMQYIIDEINDYLNNVYDFINDTTDLSDNINDYKDNGWYEYCYDDGDEDDDD